MQEDGESPVHVVIRVRPLTARESAQGQKVAWSHDEERIWQAMPGGVGRTYVPPQVYGFDRVYGANESSEVLHKECVAPSVCLLYTSPSPRDKRQSRMPSSA